MMKQVWRFTKNSNLLASRVFHALMPSIIHTGKIIPVKPTFSYGMKGLKKSEMIACLEAMSWALNEELSHITLLTDY